MRKTELFTLKSIYILTTSFLFSAFRDFGKFGIRMTHEYPALL